MHMAIPHQARRMLVFLMASKESLKHVFKQADAL